MEVGIPHAPQQKNRHAKGIDERLAHVRLHQPVVMNHSQDGADVNQTMERLPALSSEAADHAGRGSLDQGQDT